MGNRKKGVSRERKEKKEVKKKESNIFLNIDLN